MKSPEEINKSFGIIITARSQGDYQSAQKEINQIIDSVEGEMKAQCMYFQGLVNIDCRYREQALTDLINARALIKSGSYTRMLVELEIGKLFEQQGRLEEALQMYRNAVITCSEGTGFSCHRALNAFLALNGDEIDERDIGLISIAIQKSWDALDLARQLDLSNLSSSIRKLSLEFYELVNKERYLLG